MLGGHVHIGNDVTISGGVAVHHFASIGQLSFVGGMSRVSAGHSPVHDLPTAIQLDRDAANVVGLKRHDYPQEDIQVLSQAYKLLYRSRVGDRNGSRRTD